MAASCGACGLAWIDHVPGCRDRQGLFKAQEGPSERVSVPQAPSSAPLGADTGGPLLAGQGWCSPNRSLAGLRGPLAVTAAGLRAGGPTLTLWVGRGGGAGVCPAEGAWRGPRLPPQSRYWLVHRRPQTEGAGGGTLLPIAGAGAAGNGPKKHHTSLMQEKWGVGSVQVEVGVGWIAPRGQG